VAESQLTPILLKVGSQKRKKIKQLKAGEGSLIEEVRSALVEAGVDLTRADHEVVPVVILYEQRRKKSATPLLSTLLLGK
jgi:hypothetical protein